jgi:hypothetical protein
MRALPQGVYLLPIRRRRHLPRNGTQRFCALLAMLYCWAFVAVGLVHSHDALPLSPQGGSSAKVVTNASVAFVATSVAKKAGDGTCSICAAVQASAVVFSAPAVPTAALAVGSHAWPPSSDLAAVRIPGASRPRAPPQA